MPAFLTDFYLQKIASGTYYQWREDGRTPKQILKIAEELDYLAQEELAEKREG